MTGYELASRLNSIITAGRANPDDPAVAEAALTLAVDAAVEFWDRQARIEELLEQIALIAQNAETRARG
jgi:hypothetical protein